jgi:hypothetical protein
MTTEPKRVYLDTCVYNRPFDDQAQPRVWLETLRRQARMLRVCTPTEFVELEAAGGG